MQSAEANSGGTQLLNHVSSPTKVFECKMYFISTVLFFSSVNVNFGCMFYSEARLEQDYYVKGSQKKYLILLWHLHF
ncbi:hypothetical protein AMTRI_Chr03g54710 [Amborella trichopoda]